MDKDLLEARNILDVANVILDSAMLRRETRACHAREDFPTLGAYRGWSIVQKGREPYILKLKR